MEDHVVIPTAELVQLPDFQVDDYVIFPLGNITEEGTIVELQDRGALVRLLFATDEMLHLILYEDLEPLKFGSAMENLACASSVNTGIVIPLTIAAEIGPYSKGPDGETVVMIFPKTPMYFLPDESGKTRIAMILPVNTLHAMLPASPFEEEEKSLP